MLLRTVGTLTYWVNRYFPDEETPNEGSELLIWEGAWEPLWVLEVDSQWCSPDIFFLTFNPANTLSFNKHLLL